MASELKSNKEIKKFFSENLIENFKSSILSVFSPENAKKKVRTISGWTDEVHNF